MDQQQAEQEAARRNLEDERRDRFAFYAFDHSAGLAPDAWGVEMRLRIVEELVEVAGPAVATAEHPPARTEPGRRFGLVQAWGAFVILVGLAFAGAVLSLAIGLQDYTHLGALPTSVGVGAGLFAVWVGVRLVRPHD